MLAMPVAVACDQEPDASVGEATPTWVTEAEYTPFKVQEDGRGRYTRYTAHEELVAPEPAPA